MTFIFQAVHEFVPQNLGGHIPKNHVNFTIFSTPPRGVHEI